ncbi:hypothetical protein FHX69_0180 [Prauserella muralis]|nr:hypothetical protein FHX69_0180 [Prauserella muralis]
MHSVPMINGRCWEWKTPNGWEYQAISLNGVESVRLYFKTPGAKDWLFGHERPTEGRSAKSVAEDMFRSTTRSG